MVYIAINTVTNYNIVKQDLCIDQFEPSTNLPFPGNPKHLIAAFLFY